MRYQSTAFYLPEDCILWIRRQAATEERSMSKVVTRLIRQAQREADEKNRDTA